MHEQVVGIARVDFSRVIYLRAAACVRDDLEWELQCAGYHLRSDIRIWNGRFVGDGHGKPVARIPYGAGFYHVPRPRRPGILCYWADLPPEQSAKGHLSGRKDFCWVIAASCATAILLFLLAS